MGATGLTAEGVCRALYDLEHLGLRLKRYGFDRVCSLWGGTVIEEAV